MTTPRTHTRAAPKLSEPYETPADEWAKETEGAIDQHSPRKAMDRDRSNAPTPGYELPGAFPMSSTPDASPTSTDFGEVAKQNIEGVYSTAEQAARQYLPTSIIDKLEGVGVLRENLEYHEKPSLPTTDSGSNLTSTHGRVGSLSGSKDEAEVAVHPEETREEETNKKTINATIVTETESQSTHNTPPLSANSTSPHTITEPPDLIPFPLDSSDSLKDQQITPNASSNMNPSSPNPASDNGEMNTFQRAHSTEKLSTPSTSVSCTGTLTSPDSDVQAAARAGQDATGTGEGTPVGSMPGGQLSAPPERVVNGGTNDGTETKEEGSPAQINMPLTEGTQTTKNGIPLCEDGGDGEGGKEKTVVGNGKKSHIRKSSFVQRLKGEAKAFAEKVKTKTRG